jgi:hypothetical protein
MIIVIGVVIALLAVIIILLSLGVPHIVVFLICGIALLVGSALLS